MAEEQPTSSARVNGLVWITSLHDDEKGVTERIIDDLTVLFMARGVSLEVFEPKSAKELLDFLDTLAERARKGFKPIIHIDTHGGEDVGIGVAASGEAVSWPQMADAFRKVNAATGNNLCIVSLACFGFHIAKFMPIEQASPWYFLAAPDRLYFNHEIEKFVVPFYDDLFLNFDLMQAFRKTFGKTLIYLHSETWFFDLFCGYIIKYCKGKAAKERVERLLTEWRLTTGATGRDLKAVRKKLKEGIKNPDGKTMRRYADRFLLDKPFSFSIGEVRKRVAELQRAGLKSVPHPGRLPG